MATLMRPGNLPELQQLDVVKPLQAYYLGQQNQRRNALVDSRLNMQNMQLQEYEQNQPLRQKESEVRMAAATQTIDSAEQRKDAEKIKIFLQRVENDEKLQAIGTENAMRVDAGAPDAQEQIAAAASDTVDHWLTIGMPESYAEEMKKTLGAISPGDMLDKQRELKGKLDHRYKVVGGRLVDISGDKPEVIIDSIDKTPKATLLDIGLVSVDGKLVDVSDPNNIKEVYSGGEDGEDGPIFKQKIDQIKVDFPGISDKDATALALNKIAVKTNPVTGEHTIVNSIEGTSKPLIDKQQPDVSPEPNVSPEPKGKSIWDLSDLSTGPGSAIRQGASIISGMVGGPIAEETIQARQFVTSAKNELIRALSINPRFPVGEINRIKEEINLSPTIMDNPKTFRARAKSIDRYLDGRLEKEIAASKNKNLPVEQRKAAFAALTDIEHFIKILGVPPGISAEVWETLKSGDEFFDENGTLKVKP